MILLTGFAFLLFSWFAAPMGSGGWYAVQVGPFAVVEQCERAAAQARGAVDGGRLATSSCFPVSR